MSENDPAEVAVARIGETEEETEHSSVRDDLPHSEDNKQDKRKETTKSRGPENVMSETVDDGPEEDSDANEKQEKVAAPKRGRPRKTSVETPVEKKKMGRPKDASSTNVTCDICGKFFKFRYALKAHEQTHYGAKEFECDYCHKRFLRKGALGVHLRQHTGEKPYKCPHCPASFRGKTSFDYHLFRHTQQGAKCPQCPSVFATLSIVKQHIRDVHTTEKAHVCQICGVSYKHRRSLMDHLETHDKRICSVCGKVFSTIFALKTHMHVHETNPKCNYCQRSFKSEEELQAHSKLRGRTYQCDMCCYSFNKAEFLNNHNRRDHWKELGLERLPRNIVPRPKKPKPEGPKVRKSKAILPIMQIGNQSATDYSRPLIRKNLSISSAECPTFTEPLLPAEVNQHPIAELTAKPDLLATIVKKHIADGLLNTEPKLSTWQENKVKEAQIDSDHDFNTYLGEVGDCEFNSEEGEQNNVQETDSCVTKVEVKVEPDVLGEDTSVAPSLEPGDFVKVEITETDKPVKGEDVTVPKVDPVESNPEGLEEKKDILSDSEDDEIPLASLRSKLGYKGKLKKFVSSKKKETTLQVHKEKPSRKSAVSSDDDRRLYPIDDSLDSSRSTTSEDEDDDDDVIKTEKPKLKRRRRRKKPYLDMTCPICGDVLKGRTALKEHKKSAHPDVKANAGPSICELCGKSYASATSLAVHRSQHKEYQRFKCEECPKAFTFQCFLENHIRIEHRQERLICPLCGKQFKYSSDLKRHLVLHEEEKPIKCEECPATFRHPSGLYRHRAIHQKTVFTCIVCNKNFRYAESLQVHKRTHSGVKRFRCEICDREFSQKAPLMKHMSIHSVDRQVKCVVCDQVYYKKVELLIHQAKEHPNHPLIGKTIAVHTCNVCGKEFTKERHLRVHSDIHGNEYRFKCDMCADQKFKQMAGLRHHWKHFHQIEPPKKGSGKKPKGAVTSSIEPGPTEEFDNGFMIQRMECESNVSN